MDKRHFLEDRCNFKCIVFEKQINLNWLRTFEAAARHLNFTETATELGLTQTAVSLHIRSLEDRLGSRLFHRRARHLSLTEVGQAYVSTVRQSLSDVSLVTASLFRSTSNQLITLMAPISISALWLAPSEKLSDEFIVPICSIDLGKKKHPPKEIVKGPLIRILGQESDWVRYLAAHDLAMPPNSIEFFVDTMTAAIELAANGGGYAVVMKRLVDMANRSQPRVSVVGDEVPIPNAYYLMRPQSKRSKRPEVQLFENWLFEEFSEDTNA